MLLVALGYDADIQGYVGENWAIAIATDAVAAGIDASLNLSAPLAREDAAQMAFQTLTANMVSYASKGTNITTTDGTTVVVGASPAAAVAVSGEAGANYAGAAGAGVGYQQFCEKYFPKLALTTTVDDLNRPAQAWTYQNKEVCTTASQAAYSFVVSKADKTAADLILAENKRLDLTTYDGHGAAGEIVTINGNDTYTAAADETLKIGDEVQVYVSAANANQVTTVAVTRYSVATLTGEVSTKTESGVTSVRVPGVVSSYTDVEDVIGYEGLVSKDVVYYYVANGVTVLAKADSFEGQLTGTSGSKYAISGSNYAINGNVATITGVNSTPVYNTDYTYYTDANGYLIAATAISAAASDYVVIDEIAYVAGSGLASTDRVEARLVHMDGTTSIETIASVNSGTYTYTGIDHTDRTGDTTNADHKLAYDKGTAASTVTVALDTTVAGLAKTAFYTYTVDNKGAYALTQVVENVGQKLTVGTLAADIATGSATIGTLAANSNTVFVVTDNNGGYKTYTGVGNVPAIGFNSTYTSTAYVAKSGIATYVFAGQYNSASLTGDSVFFLSTTKTGFTSEKTESGTIYYNTYKAIVNGEATTVKVNAASGGSDSITGSVAVELLNPTYDSNGVITALSDNTNDVAGAQSYVISGGTLVVNDSDGYTCAGTAPVYLVDSQLNVTATTASELSSDVNDTVYVVKTTSDGSTVSYLVIFEMDNDETGLSELSSAGDDEITLDKTKTEQTVTAEAAGKDYTITATAADGKATVTFSKDNGSNWAAADDTTNKVTGSVQGGDPVSIWVKVTAADGVATQIYKITINALPS
jgi:hypothetical protein